MERSITLLKMLVVGKSAVEVRRLAGMLSDKGPNVTLPTEIADLLVPAGILNRSTRAILAQVLNALADLDDFCGDCPNTHVA